MISKFHIAHCEQDEPLARELVRALWAVELRAFHSCTGRLEFFPGERIRFGIRQSDCFIPILTKEGAGSQEVNQKSALAVG